MVFIRENCQYLPPQASLAFHVGIRSENLHLDGVVISITNLKCRLFIVLGSNFHHLKLGLGSLVVSNHGGHGVPDIRVLVTVVVIVVVVYSYL